MFLCLMPQEFAFPTAFTEAAKHTSEKVFNVTQKLDLVEELGYFPALSNKPTNPLLYSTAAESISHVWTIILFISTKRLFLMDKNNSHCRHRGTLLAMTKTLIWD